MKWNNINNMNINIIFPSKSSTLLVQTLYNGLNCSYSISVG